MNPILSILRAIVKSIPIVNPIIEAIENRKANKAIAKAMISGEILNNETKVKMVEGQPEKPHDWLSIAVQLIVIGSIVYGFVTKTITIDKLIELLNGI